jgi:hypothetical protein
MGRNNCSDGIRARERGSTRDRLFNFFGESQMNGALKQRAIECAQVGRATSRAACDTLPRHAYGG